MKKINQVGLLKNIHEWLARIVGYLLTYTNMYDYNDVKQ